MTLNGKPPPPDPGCFWHGPEEITPSAYAVCAECGHCYPTAEDFLRAHREAHQDAMDHASRPEYRPAPLPDTVTAADFPYCALCAHDL
jgi:hypothetical protein